MRKRGTLGKGLVVIAFWVLGAAILILTLAQVRDYAGIINDSGVVRGGTQRVVKMELVGQSATSTEQRVTSLLEKLTANEEKRLYKGVETSAVGILCCNQRLSAKPHTSFFLANYSWQCLEMGITRNVV